MLHPKHPLNNLIKAWKVNDVNTSEKNNIIETFAPHMQNFLASTALTHEQREKLLKDTQKITEVTDKHLTNINTRYTE